MGIPEAPSAPPSTTSPHQELPGEEAIPTEQPAPTEPEGGLEEFEENLEELEPEVFKEEEEVPVKTGEKDEEGKPAGSRPEPVEKEPLPDFRDVFPEHFRDDPHEYQGAPEEADPFLEGEKVLKAVVATPDRIAKLMAYLGNLTNFLPPDKKLQLLSDHIPLKMERIQLNLNDGPLKPQGEGTSARRKIRELIDKVREKIQ